MHATMLEQFIPKFRNTLVCNMFYDINIHRHITINSLKTLGSLVSCLSHHSEPPKVTQASALA